MRRIRRRIHEIQDDSEFRIEEWNRSRPLNLCSEFSGEVSNLGLACSQALHRYAVLFCLFAWWYFMRHVVLLCLLQSCPLSYEVVLLCFFILLLYFFSM
jgi:hypothetical protein